MIMAAEKFQNTTGMVCQRRGIISAGTGFMGAMTAITAIVKNVTNVMTGAKAVVMGIATGINKEGLIDNWCLMPQLRR